MKQGVLSILSAMLSMVGANLVMAQPYSYDIVFKRTDVPVQMVKLQFAVLTDKVLVKGFGTENVTCKNQGLVIPRNGSTDSNELAGAIRNSARYRVVGKDHTINLTQISRWPNGEGHTVRMDLSVRLEGNTCQLVSYADGIRNDKTQPGQKIVLNGGTREFGFFVCVPRPIAEFESTRACTRG